MASEMDVVTLRVVKSRKKIVPFVSGESVDVFESGFRTLYLIKERKNFFCRQSYKVKLKTRYDLISLIFSVSPGDSEA